MRRLIGITCVLAMMVCQTGLFAADLPGSLTSGVFDTSEIFPGTTRNYSVYVPSQYQGDEPANLMVFMDGRNYVKPGGSFRVPEVFEKLIDAGEMPVTVAVFVDPGSIKPAAGSKETPAKAKVRSNRSFEYDSLGDRYTKFLVDEFLPVALDGVAISDDPSDRAVCGISSGGICAFTVAWQRPEEFGKVLTHIGSYTNIRGGWAYPGLIRKTHVAPKPIKVYLHEGRDDLNNLHGNWPLGNRDMAAALQFAGYTYQFVLTEGGHTSKFAGQVFDDALRWLWDDDAKSTVIAPTQTKPTWEPAAEAMVKDDVPQGTVHVMPPWESNVFPNTIRDWAVYVPSQYDPQKPAALMVFQDGERMRDVEGRWRVPVVFDNLIAAGEMPPTIAVFLNPGHDKSKPRKGRKSSNRGFEYDSLGDRYSRFLTDEILPVVEKQYNISSDPAMRAIGGSSSGAICAFTVAWERPDLFGKVYSNVGSFTNLRGGDVYPGMIRKTEPKPIRMFMSDTSGDVDNAFGSWPIANQRMASALKYMGYDSKLVWAEGYAHNADFGSMQFPAAMRWLWRDETYVPTIDTSDDLRGDLTLLDLLIPNQGWQKVADSHKNATAACSDADGNFYYSDAAAGFVYRIDAQTESRTTIANVGVGAMSFGSDGMLYAAQASEQRVIAIDVNNGTTRVVAKDVRPNDLLVTESGKILFTETRTGQINRIDPNDGSVTVVAEDVGRPNGIALSPDGGTLAVSDHGGAATWTFRVDGSAGLSAKMPTMPMRLAIDTNGEFKFNSPPPYVKGSRGDGMTVDRVGRYYVTSKVGIQVFDPTGRPCGVLAHPGEAQTTSCAISGSDGNWLYATDRTSVYRRKLTVDRSK